MELMVIAVVGILIQSNESLSVHKSRLFAPNLIIIIEQTPRVLYNFFLELQ